VTVANANLEPYYRAAILDLRALEARGGRRRSFGPDADARWGAFRGELRDGVRLDLLLRAASKGSPAAFAPRVVFPVEGLADDEPFGPDWPGVPLQLATALVREATAPLGDTSLRGVLTAAAQAWGITPKLIAPAALEQVAAATRILAAGAGATVALAEKFSGRSDLDLPQQVIFVADSPGERQLVGLAVALLGSASQVRLAAPDTSAEQVRSGFPRANLVVISDDVSEPLRAAAEALARELSR
jgi:hypothetical protein